MVKIFCDPWSNYTRHRGIILCDFSTKFIHPCVVMDDVLSSCFHTKTWDILPVWELLFSKLSWLVLWTCCLLITPRTKNHNEASFLKQMIPAISHTSEKEVQKDQCAFLFPWGWLLFLSSDSHKARTQAPAMGYSFFLCTSPQAPLELPGLFVKREPCTPGSSYR